MNSTFKSDEFIPAKVTLNVHINNDEDILWFNGSIFNKKFKRL